VPSICQVTPCLPLRPFGPSATGSSSHIRFKGTREHFLGSLPSSSMRPKELLHFESSRPHLHLRRIDQYVGSTGQYAPTANKFTGKERDSETGNDHFSAREYSSTMGRWIRPDPLPWLDWQHGNKEEREQFEDFIANPQNFNMYSYVNNNPLNKTDPTGMKGCQAGDKKFETCTITIVYDPKTSNGTITVTGHDKGDKVPTVLVTGSVVVGGDGHVTPTGTFTATTWEKDHVSRKYGSWANTKWSDSWIGKNVFGPFQLHIGELEKQGIWIHGTLGPSWSPTTWGNTVVGSTSHGWIRLCNQDDIALHNLMPNPRGNQIIIKTTPKPDDDDQ